MQPLRPQPQRRPPCLTTMWPTSPADERPSQARPSSTTPPPTPVPQKTPEQRAERAPGAERDLGVGGDLHVVAERDARAEPVGERVAQLEGALPAGDVDDLRDGAELVLDGPGRADADAVERGGLGARGRGRLLDRGDHARRDALGPAVGRRRAARLPLDRAGVVDHRRLDLRAAEVDAAVQMP